MVENRGPGPRARRCRARGACSPSGPRGAGSGRTPACRSRAERPHAPAYTHPRLSVHSLPWSRPRCRRPPGSRRAVRRLDPCVCCGVVAASAGDPAVVMRRNPQLTGLCGSSARHGGCERVRSSAARSIAVSPAHVSKPDPADVRRTGRGTRRSRGACRELSLRPRTAVGAAGRAAATGIRDAPGANEPGHFLTPPPEQGGLAPPTWVLPPAPQHPGTPAPQHEYSEPMQRARKGLFLTVWRGAGSPSLGHQEPSARLQPLSSPGLRCWPWNGPPRWASHPWGCPGRIPKMLAREVTGQPPFPVINTKPLRAAEEQTEASGGRLALAE